MGVIGADANGAWLLVANQGTLGWAPTIHIGSAVGSLPVPVISEIAPSNCAESLFNAASLNDGWLSETSGDVIVRGFVYRPQPSSQSGSLPPGLQVEGAGSAGEPIFQVTTLDAFGELIQFAYYLSEVAPGSRVSFAWTGASNEPVAFQALFLSESCSMIAGDGGELPPQPGGGGAVEPLPVITIVVGGSPGNSSGGPSSNGGCGRSPARRLRVNEGAVVVTQNGSPLRLRATAGTGGRIVASLAAGTGLTVTGGAQCVNGYWWWQVRTGGGNQGWAAEGFGDNYYLAPAALAGSGGNDGSNPPAPAPPPSGNNPPVTLEFHLGEQRCISNSEWQANITVWAQGGNGHYTFYRDDQVVGEASSGQQVTFTIRWGEFSGAPGTLSAVSGDRQSASQQFWFPMKEC